MLATFNNHLDCIPLLLQEVKILDDNEFTALMYSAQKGHKECVEILTQYEIGMVGYAK